MIDKKYVLIKNYKFLASGTILKADIAGDYFVIIDNDHNQSRAFMETGTIRINGFMVENTPELFEQIKEPSISDKELITQLAIETQQEFGASGLADGICLDFAIDVAEKWYIYKTGGVV